MTIPTPGAAERFSADPVDSSLSPEESFDRTWALNLIEQALAELRDEYGASGRAELYGALAQHVWGDSRAEAHAVTAHRLGMTERAFTVAVSRLRERLRKRLSAHVAATVGSESEIAGELRHLLEAVRSGARGR